MHSNDADLCVGKHDHDLRVGSLGSHWADKEVSRAEYQLCSSQLSACAPDYSAFLPRCASNEHIISSLTCKRKFHLHDLYLDQVWRRVDCDPTVREAGLLSFQTDMAPCLPPDYY